MLLEILASLILWTGFDQDARLQVSCAAVTLTYGGKPTARPIPVAFWMRDETRDWLYVVPMPVLPNGKIKLEPTEFWVERIRQQKNLKIKVKNKIYNFDLTGTRNLINCD